MDSPSRVACDVCGKYFYTAVSLKMHVVRAHGQRTKQSVDSQPVAGVGGCCTASEENAGQPVGKKGSRCTICKRCFPNDRRLASHVQAAHSVHLSPHKQKRAYMRKGLRHGALGTSESQLTDIPTVSVLQMDSESLSDAVTQQVPARAFTSVVNVPPTFDALSIASTTSDDVVLEDIPRHVEPVRITRSSVRTLHKQQVHAGTTQKQHIRERLRKELEELKKKCAGETCAEDSDQLLASLTLYHDRLLSEADNVLTERLSAEVLEVIEDASKVDDVNRPFRWSEDDECRLNGLNGQARMLQTPNGWRWSAKEGTDQYVYNHKRMQYLVEHELETVIKHCDRCKTTGILVGLDQVDSALCHDCVLDSRCRSDKINSEKAEAWDAVRPPTLDHHGLPRLYAGDKAVLALVHPVVTVRKHYRMCAKVRQESITLMNDANQTWTKILPRADLKDRFVVIERTSKDHSKKHIVADPERVRVWLQFLFQNHPEFIRRQKDGELELSDDALRALEAQSELGEVVDDVEYEEESSDDESCAAVNEYRRRSATVQPALESGFSSSDVFTFDKHNSLYLKAKDFLKIKQDGKIHIIEDHQQRIPIYNASATVCFPYLYLHGEKSPLDFRDYKLSRYLLKKQSLFAYKLTDSQYTWEYAEDDIHMMHSYAKLVERTVSANTAWFLQQSPDAAHLPIGQVLEAFKNGFASEDQSLIDSKLPGLSNVMVQLPNSRERWFSERLGIEAISRDFGDPNLFLTLNNSPRESYDTRLLLHKLEHGSDVEFDPNYYERDTERFTRLMSKYAPQMSVYLCRKTKMFLQAFLCDICGIQEKEPNGDWTTRDRLTEGYYWSRVEFTSTRGVQHWHCLAKLPHVLDTGVIGRMIQNGRVVRQEIKCANIKPGMEEKAWEIVSVGLLANRYAILFADSLSMASFYTEHMDVDSYDVSKEIDVDKLRQEFTDEYFRNNINMKTHPIMRRFCDTDVCDSNRFVEMAQVAAVSCMHHCISTICGGDSKTQKGCRFEFPKRRMNHTVPAIMQVNSSQNETRMLLRRTCDRVPNLNEYFLLYWRGNHDVTVLVDAAHKMRYATKYAAKSGRHSELLNEIIEYLSQRSVSDMPPNMQIVLSQLLLADVSHRSFMTKQELATT